MGLAFIAYLVLTIGKIGAFFNALAIAIGLVIVVLIIVFPMAIDFIDAEYHKQLLQWAKRLIIIGVVSSFISIIIPSKEDSYIIAGAYFAKSVGEVVIESPEASEIRELVMSKLRDTLKVETTKTE